MNIYWIFAGYFKLNLKLYPLILKCWSLINKILLIRPIMMVLWGFIVGLDLSLVSLKLKEK
jgi:hypothetical protein